MLRRWSETSTALTVGDGGGGGDSGATTATAARINPFFSDPAQALPFLAFSEKV